MRWLICRNKNFLSLSHFRITTDIADNSNLPKRSNGLQNPLNSHRST